jgi:hypothetical protein
MRRIAAVIAFVLMLVFALADRADARRGFGGVGIRGGGFHAGGFRGVGFRGGVAGWRVGRGWRSGVAWRGAGWGYGPRIGIAAGLGYYASSYPYYSYRSSYYPSSYYYRSYYPYSYYRSGYCD